MRQKHQFVLILILMEHAQRDMVEDEGRLCYVLILILMEHAQRGCWQIDLVSSPNIVS